MSCSFPSPIPLFSIVVTGIFLPTFSSSIELSFVFSHHSSLHFFCHPAPLPSHISLPICLSYTELPFYMLFHLLFLSLPNSSTRPRINSRWTWGLRGVGEGEGERREGEPCVGFEKGGKKTGREENKVKTGRWKDLEFPLTLQNYFLQGRVR